MGQYIIESAKNGNATCKFVDAFGEKYIYSKYRPEQVQLNWDLDEQVDAYVIVGLGLGYEFLQLKTKTTKPIYVIEHNETFIEFSKRYMDFTPEIITNLEEIEGSFQLLMNSKIVQNEPLIYKKNVQQILKRTYRKTIVCFDYPVIVKDFKAAFEQLNYDVVFIDKNDFVQWFNSNEIIPEFIFSINYNLKLAQIAEKVNIPYASLTVDTPAYPLFHQDNLTLMKSYIFHYDEKIVMRLKERGLKNVFYMPVAANIERFDQFKKTNDFEHDVTFVGHSSGHNSYEQFLKESFTEDERYTIEQLIEKQMQTNDFVILEDLGKFPEKYGAIVNKIVQSPQMIYAEGNLSLMTDNEFVSLIIGRQHSYIERQRLVDVLERNFNFKVYGDQHWEQTNSKSYTGNADHYSEMPAIFKNSKININLIRSFVDSGLPMRVFDVLGCGGFLLTNEKADVHKYFVDGEHLVIFNDFEDLVEKVQYYLEHEEERQRIAQNGYELVKSQHTFRHRAQQIINIVSKG